MMTKPGKQGLTRIIHATGYSMKGLRAAWIHEEAFRLEASLAVICIPAAFWAGEDLTQTLLLIICSAIVLISELINSAIEAVVDRISSEIHPLSGQAKDIGSAAVFVSLLLFITAWGMTLWQNFLSPN